MLNLSPILAAPKTHSEELILFWGVTLLIWGIWTIRLASRFHPRRARQILVGESGLSYTLAFVLTMPIYFLTCLLVGELTLLLMTKIGSVYAAYAGARSATVWENMEEDLKNRRVRQSIVNALAPFAMSGENRFGSAGLPDGDAPLHALEYVHVLSRYSGEDVESLRVGVHYLKVDARTEYEIEIPTKEYGADLTCRVTYRAPFLTPGVARLLDPDHTWPYEYPITSEVTLTLERPLSEEGTLGIDYEAY